MGVNFDLPYRRLGKVIGTSTILAPGLQDMTARVSLNPAGADTSEKLANILRLKTVKPDAGSLIRTPKINLAKLLATLLANFR